MGTWNQIGFTSGEIARIGCVVFISQTAIGFACPLLAITARNPILLLKSAKYHHHSPSPQGVRGKVYRTFPHRNSISLFARAPYLSSKTRLRQHRMPQRALIGSRAVAASHGESHTRLQAETIHRSELWNENASSAPSHVMVPPLEVIR